MKESRYMPGPFSLRFRREREKPWRRLERMVERAFRKGAGSLSPEEIEELPSLYRNVLSSLSIARATVLDRALVEYLESLAARAWLVVYCSRPPLREALGNAASRIPAAVRAVAGEFLLAALVFFSGVALAWVLTSSAPEWFYAFVDSAMAAGRDPWASKERLAKTLYDGGGWSSALSTFASFLFTHNARIGILAFSVGIAAGLPTFFLLFTNGLGLGAFLSIFAEKGLLFPFLGWLLPHGVPEILALLLCGAAGLHLGRAWLFPGREKRALSLKRGGVRAAVVVAGAVFLFAWAGLMEGVFRQLVLSDTYRFAAAGLDLLLLVLAGRAVFGERERV